MKMKNFFHLFLCPQKNMPKVTETPRYNKDINDDSV